MNSRLGYLLAGALVALAPVVHASNLALDRPVLGFVFDSDTGELHRIDGSLGSSHLSEPIDLGLPILRASVAPSHELAIAQDADGRTLLLNLSRLVPEVTELEGVMSDADGVAFGPSGRVAAFYDLSEGRVQWIHGLGGSPAVGDEMDSLGGLGELSGLAISDSGTLLVATRGSDGGSLYMLPRARQIQRVGSVQGASGLTFLRGQDDAIVTDADADEVILLRSEGDAWHAVAIASASDGINRPLQPGVTADGTHAVVTLADGVFLIPLDGGAASFVGCGCVPSTLIPLAGGSTFLLTPDLREPLQAVEVDDSGGRVRFIPALAADETAVF